MKKFDDLIKGLKLSPYGTKQHAEALKKLQKDYLSKYKDQFILCTQGIVTKEKALGSFNGVIEGDHDFLNKHLKDNVFVSDQFYFHNRELCEWNLQHRQVIVNAIVTNKNHDKFIMLKSNDGKITMIGGHVDYNISDYSVLLHDTLRRNMVKETSEEVKNSKIIIDNTPEFPGYLVQCNERGGEFYDLFHIFYIYLIELDDELFEEQAKKMGVNEKNHIPVVMTKKEIISSRSKSSVKLIINHLT